MAVAAATLAQPVIPWRPTATGRIETLSCDALPRTRVWLPPGYDRSGLRYKTLYLLDGQWAFAGDAGGVTLSADTRAAWLMASDTIRPTIIVAIDNLGDDRFLQYMPQTIYDEGGPDLRAGVEREIANASRKQLLSAPFIDALVRELKPRIDAAYRTLPGRLDTAIFGASMAGIMSGAIFVEAGDTFGLGGCMSPNWAVYDGRFLDYPGLPEQWAGYFGKLDPLKAVACGSITGRR